MQNKLTNRLHRTRYGVNAFTMIACIATIGFASVPAQASSFSPQTVTTRIDNFLLRSENGAQRVYKKLSKRAENACTSSGHQTLRDRRVNNACAVDLLNDFVVDLGDERVIAYHQKATME